jgi:hypothetical protein
MWNGTLHSLVHFGKGTVSKSGMVILCGLDTYTVQACGNLKFGMHQTQHQNVPASPTIRIHACTHIHSHVHSPLENKKRNGLPMGIRWLEVEACSPLGVLLKYFRG